MRLRWYSALVLVFSLLSHAAFAANGVSYRMAVELDPKTERIAGHESVRVVNRTGTRLDRLYFHVYPNAFRWEKDGTYMREIRAFENPNLHFLKAGGGAWLRVDDIHAGPDKLRFEIERELLTVFLPHSLVAGASVTLELDFVTQMAPIAERSGVWDGNYSVGQWFPKLMVYDAQGWALQHNGGYHFTGEFYGDFGDYDVDITVPREMTVGATGHLEQESDAGGGRKRLTYHATQVHDFAWVADKNFEVQTTQVGQTTIRVLSRNASSRIMIDYAKAAFKYYSERVGTYPYRDFTVAETYYNGTMEYPQIIFIRSWPTKLARSFERDALALLELGVAHETGHQWFYGAVGNNEVVDAWLDEGFTTYLEEAYFRDRYGSDENVVRVTNLLKLTDRELGDAIWRSQAPDVTQPIQTPSYQFEDPMHYYASVYYKTALFFRHFEALVGRKSFDQILREYFRRNQFHNAVPDDWYGVVRELAGAEAERWWRDWITRTLRSDYALGAVHSERTAAGTFISDFEVRQDGDFYAPVDVQVTDKAGSTRRLRASIGPSAHSVALKLETAAALAEVEVDPDHVAPDFDRFNNRPGFFPTFELWPFSTSKLREDAITLVPLPYILKRPGIGLETGVFLGAAHYLDWYGYGFFGYDWQHRSLTVSSAIETLQADMAWGWGLAWQRDVLVSQGRFFAKKSLGPAVGHDPQSTIKIGPEYFGDLGDRFRATGLGLGYTFSNLNHGRDVRYALTVHNTMLKNIGQTDSSDRVLGTARLILPLGFRSAVDIKANLGTSFGPYGKTTAFDLQADQEGGMRFDYADLGQFKTRTLKTANVELQFPIPYSGWSDALGFIHGPSWEWHLFGDVASGRGAVTGKPFLFDAGIGTRFDPALGGYSAQLGISFNLELVPYQNVVGTTGWQLPLVLFSISERL